MSLLLTLHLDLKGVQFRPEYLPQLLDDASAQGINSLLVEYEDLFPFAGIDIAEDKAAAWTPEKVRDFLDLAGARGLEVIPFQQCLAHFEYLLRWESFAAYALDPSYPGTLDIFNPAAKKLAISLLQQVMDGHPDSRYVFLGMDEARALVKYAAQNEKDVVALFLGWLEELCVVCERAGKTPIVSSDMLEDYLTPVSLPLFEAFRDRVILCPWDYRSHGETIQNARIGGWRVSREWRDEPQNPNAPAIGRNQLWLEDLAPEIAALVEPYRRGRGFLAIFQVDLWTQFGFRVFGATAVRASADGPLLPNFDLRRANIGAWSRAVERSGSVGVFATSWARGTTFCRPNFFFDLTWPLISEFTRAMGQNPPPFFPGIDEATMEQILLTLGRCRSDWRIESEIAAQMEALESQLQNHHFEWRSLILMARAHDFERRSNFAGLEVHDFAGADRLPRAEWERRACDQTNLLEESQALKKEVRSFFEKRYFGAAFEEWLSAFFDSHERNLLALQEISRAQLKIET